MFSGSVMMILKLFTRSEGLPSSLIWISMLFCTFFGGFRLYPHFAPHHHPYESQISSAGSNNFTNLKISCLSFATSLVVLMEGLGWEPRLYDLVGLERLRKIDILLNWSSGWKIEMQKNKLNFFLRNLRFYKLWIATKSAWRCMYMCIFVEYRYRNYDIWFAPPEST